MLLYMGVHPLMAEQVTQDVERQLVRFRQEPFLGAELDALTLGLTELAQWENLAMTCEVAAARQEDISTAIDLWARASHAREMQGDQARVESCLRQILDLDGANLYAVKKLLAAFHSSNRFSDAADVYDRWAQSRNQDVQQLSTEERAEYLEWHLIAAALWHEKLARPERALVHCLLGWEIAKAIHPVAPKAALAAKELCLWLGQYEQAVTLLDELGRVCVEEAKPLRAAWRMEQAKLLQRLDQPLQAIPVLQAALAEMPENEELQRKLAESVASAATLDAELVPHARGLLLDLATAEAERDRESAKQYARRALGLDPFSGDATLLQALKDLGLFRELDNLYENILQTELTPEDREHVLRQRIALLEQDLPKPDALVKTVEQLLLLHPADPEITQRLVDLALQDGNWARVAELMQTQRAHFGSDTPGLVHHLLKLSAIYREHLGDKVQASGLLHEVLNVDPGNQEATSLYSEHFRERRDWRGLADLTEFVIDQARDGGAPHPVIVRRLEELAQLAETRLGDMDRAIHAWQRIEPFEPGSIRIKEAVKRLQTRARMWTQLITMLEQEASAAGEGPERIEILRRAANVYRERQVSPGRAIELFEEVTRLAPHDELSLKALLELYEREGDDLGVARTLKRQLDLELEKTREQKGFGPEVALSAKDWPVAKRVERLTNLRRLATLYDTRLNDVEGVIFACTGILELLPGDREALERMERVLEKSGDLVRLEQTLVYHVATASGPAERVRVVRRLAAMAEARGDDVASMEHWEAIIKISPGDTESLDKLMLLYEKCNRWQELVELLEREFGRHRQNTTSIRASDLRLFAEVSLRIADTARAVRGFSRLLQVLPKDRAALDALARLYRETERWRELADVLERQADLLRELEPEKAGQALRQKAEILRDKLGANAEALLVLSKVCYELTPNDRAAHQAMYDLLREKSDWTGAIGSAERLFWLCNEPANAIELLSEIGHIAYEYLRDRRRAILAYERILAISPEHLDTLAQLTILYREERDFVRAVGTLQKRVEGASDLRDRRSLIFAAASIIGQELFDPTLGFTWLLRAHQELGDAVTLGELRRFAETWGLWPHLAEVFSQEMSEFETELAANPNGVDSERQSTYLGNARELSSIYEARLADSEAALAVIHRAIQTIPRANELLLDAERIALRANTEHTWQVFVSCLRHAQSHAAREQKVLLHLQCARVFEEKLGRFDEAVTELLAAFSWDPHHRETYQRLLEFSLAHDVWDAMIAVEAALVAISQDTALAVEKLRRQAHLVETKQNDRVLAYRLHLRAFGLAPDNQETTTHLWRLAREIGVYAPDERVPAPPKPHAAIVTGLPAAVLNRAKPPFRGKVPVNNDATMELSMEASMVLMQDVVQHERFTTSGDKTVEVEPILEPPPILARKKLAAPPPAPRHVLSPRPRPPSKPSPQEVRWIEFPQQEYESPWQELAVAYYHLPVASNIERLTWYFRAADVWELGAQKPEAAFDVLSRGLALFPDRVETKAKLERLAEQYSLQKPLVALFETMADTAASQELATGFLQSIAEIDMREQDWAGAEATYRRILGMNPYDAPSRQHLEGLARAQERWSDLAGLLEERTDPRLGSPAPTDERVVLLSELATLYRQKLGRRQDAIDTLERLRGLLPNDVSTLTQLSELYTDVGRWSKVIEILNRVADLSSGSGMARESKHRIATIYLEKLELPERAIEAYEEIAQQWPADSQAFLALEECYRTQHRFDKLDELYRRSIASGGTSLEKSQLLRRHAVLLSESLSRMDEAISLLHHARNLAPDDLDTEALLVDYLVRTERAGEGAALLEERLEHAAADKLNEGKWAGLWISLAEIRADWLNDVVGARAAIAEALKIVPGHPSALGGLAKIASIQQDPLAFAQAKEREAEAHRESDAKISCLLTAGNTYANSCGDLTAARRVFESILAISPFHADATWALAGLIEQSGDLTEASHLLEERLSREGLPALEKASLHTQLAALGKRAGALSAAEKHLDDAIAEKNDHLPAIFAKAEFMIAGERYREGLEFLQEISPSLVNTPPEARAEVLRRQADFMDRLGEDESAYQTLLEADKLQRNSVLIKLALGKNRFRSKRWREATLHLSPLGTHEKAAEYASDIAEGLAQAAIAEIRALRPERAEPLYLKAIELDPECGPALHALGELASERGDLASAVDFLGREAAVSKDASDKVRLHEAVGDLALSIGDRTRARTHYEAAVSAANPLSTKHVPLLDKLLELQQVARDSAGAGKSSELLAAFVTDPVQKVRYLKQAVTQAWTLAKYPEAIDLANRILVINAYDLTALTILSDIAWMENDYERVSGLLSRGLTHRSAAQNDDLDLFRRSALWVRLGDARKQRGDLQGATIAYQEAIASSPDGLAAINARKQLAQLWLDDAERADVVQEFLRSVAESTMAPPDILQYASKVKSSRMRGELTRLANVLSGDSDDSVDVDLSDDSRPKVARAPSSAAGDAVPTAVSAELLAKMRDENHDHRTLASVSVLLVEAAAFLFPSPDQLVQKHPGARRVAVAEAQAVASFAKFAKQLSCPPSILYANGQDEVVRVLSSSPPAILLSEEVVAKSHPTAADDFAIAVGAAKSLAEHVVALGQAPEDFALLIERLKRIFTTRDSQQASDIEFLQKLPVKIRTQLEPLCQNLRGETVNSFIKSCEEQCLRMAIAVCGLPEGGLWQSRMDHLSDLCRFMLSSEYAAAVP